MKIKIRQKETEMNNNWITKQEKAQEKRIANQVRVAHKWQDEGFTSKVIAIGLWNKMGANSEVKNNQVIIWGKNFRTGKMEIKATL